MMQLIRNVLFVFLLYIKISNCAIVIVGGNNVDDGTSNKNQIFKNSSKFIQLKTDSLATVVLQSTTTSSSTSDSDNELALSNENRDMPVVVVKEKLLLKELDNNDYSDDNNGHVNDGNDSNNNNKYETVLSVSSSLISPTSPPSSPSPTSPPSSPPPPPPPHSPLNLWTKNEEKFLSQISIADKKYHHHHHLDHSNKKINEHKQQQHSLIMNQMNFITKKPSTSLVNVKYKNKNFQQHYKQPLPQLLSSSAAALSSLLPPASSQTPPNNTSESDTAYFQRWKRDTTIQSLCAALCTCITPNKFMAVECHFSLSNKQYILGPKFYIPAEATTLLIKLSGHAQLRLDEGLFHNNKLNRITVEGTFGDLNELELGPLLFHGNHGPFPAIEIVNLNKVSIRSKPFYSEFILNITNCTNVIIFGEAFSETTFQGHFENIPDLRIHEKAFSKSTLSRVVFINCYIEDLWRLESSFKEIRFINSTIDIIKTEAFNVNQIDSLTFEQCKIKTIETRATTERLLVKKFELTGCTIDRIKTHAIFHSGITDVILQKNTINIIESNGIKIESINVLLLNNSITDVHPNWIYINQWNNITITNNKFGKFNQMFFDRTSNPVECIFSKNSIHTENKNCLNFTTTHCHLKENSFFHECLCDTKWLEDLEFHNKNELFEQSYCNVPNDLKICLNISSVNVNNFRADICGPSEVLECLKTKNYKQIENPNFLDPTNTNGTPKRLNIILIYVIVGSSILLIIITIILCFVIKKIINSKAILMPLSEINDSSTTITTNSAYGSGSGGGGSLTGGAGIGMKRSKTFSNDDRYIIRQTLENMKGRYPVELCDQVFNNTTKLLRGNLTETEKVLTIGEIVQSLDKFENTGEEMVAFTGILYKILEPKDNNQNDPVYAEPGIGGGGGGGGFNNDGHGTTLPPLPKPPHQLMGLTELNDGGGGGGDLGYDQTNLDHIYAEPHSVQQPLLTNEYQYPVDRSDQTNLYTEPLPSYLDKSHNIISPYAIGSHIDQLNNSQTQQSVKNHHLPHYSQQHQQHQQQQQQSTSRNLPDVLNKSTLPPPYMTRSPNTQRKIPKYTMPISKKPSGSGSGSSSSMMGACAVVYGQPSTSSQQPTSMAIAGPSSISQDDVNSHSDHSGGSDITCKIDDIDYADA